MSHTDSNISQNTFYLAVKGGFLRTAHSTLFLDDFIPKSKVLLNCMKSQGVKSIPTKRALRKIILSHK